MKEFFYSKQKIEPKWGKCNLCGQEGNRSWDHVPPKGGIEVSQMSVRPLFELDENLNYPVYFKNGLCFRTICESCNTWLGANYDRILNAFALGIGQILRTSLHFPDVIHYRTQPNMLVRALCAHLVAAKNPAVLNKFDNLLRSFLFDENLSIPTDLHIFYWLYPYNDTVIAHDFLKMTVLGPHANTKNPAVISVLKYFPVAYVFTDTPEYQGLPDLTAFRHLGPRDEVDVPLRLQPIHKQEWPEGFDEDSVHFLTKATEEALRAQPRKRRSPE